MALDRYLQEEVALDHADGQISRREALKRLAKLGVGAAAAGTLLAACARDDDAPKPETTPGASPPGPTPLATQDVTYDGPGGRDSFGTFAEAKDPAGAVLVIHENRGLTEHIKSVAGRFAASGYSALAADLLSSKGGTPKAGDETTIMATLRETPATDLVAEMKAGLDELERRTDGLKIGAVGFCFGGGMVWQLLNAGEPRLAAAAPFYGPSPEQPDFSGSKAAVLAIYAGMDDFVNPTRDRAVNALEAAKLKHEVVTYPGVGHAFFNSTGDRYNADAAGKAYAKVLDWFETYLA